MVTVSLSYDGSQLYLATNDADKNDIFVSFKEGKNWLAADKLDKTINGKKSNETHAVLTKDGNTLYFTSDREGGLGGVDIYKSTKNEKGKWGDPVNLGPSINTKFNEATPFLTLDDKYLFFSSEGHSSIGGYDIFYINLESKNQVINMGYPVNTTGDDLFFVPDNSLTSGYISIFDETSVGKNDIYKLTILPKVNLAGNIQNSESGKSISDEALNIAIYDENNKIIETTNTSNGQFAFEIEPGKYLVAITAENYVSDTSEIEIPSNYSSSDYTFTAQLNPIQQEEELIAEVIEEPVEEEPIIEEVKTEESVEEEIVEEQHLEEVAEVTEPKEEIVEPEVQKEEEPIIEKTEPEPEKEIEKYIPVSTSASTTTIKTYSVQLMALRKPVDLSYFKNVENVQEKLYEDGYYRYTVGNTETYAEAITIKEKLNNVGYKDAFIRTNNIIPKYTIQIMALIIPVETDYFKNISSVNVTKGADDFYRYTVGEFSDYKEAKLELAKIAELGYPNAYVKRSN